MDNLGFIHSKVEIKILILFILGKLPRGIEISTVADLVLCDAGINYFDFAQALCELTDSEHVEVSSGRYAITEKGRETLKETEDDLPFTIRLNAASEAERLARILERSAMVDTGYTEKDDGTCSVSLSLSDSLGNIMKLDILAGSIQQAREMEEKFRGSAEELYITIAGLLLQ